MKHMHSNKLIRHGALLKYEHYIFHWWTLVSGVSLYLDGQRHFCLNSPSHGEQFLLNLLLFKVMEELMFMYSNTLGT